MEKCMCICAAVTTGICRRPLRQRTDKKGMPLGFSVNFSGNKLVAGAPYAEMCGAVNHGKAYVFELENGIWHHQAILSNGQYDINDLFGFSAAIESNNIIIGAEQDTYLNHNSHGRLYYFNR
ncbi:MAG TPA: hypothetical protein PLK54_02615 [Ferruginibacter sp.]|nr:hypothetical protein [Ferruginibacter sp.]